MLGFGSRQACPSTSLNLSVVHSFLKLWRSVLRCGKPVQRRYGKGRQISEGESLNLLVFSLFLLFFVLKPLKLLADGQDIGDRHLNYSAQCLAHS